MAATSNAILQKQVQAGVTAACARHPGFAAAPWWKPIVSGGGAATRLQFGFRQDSARKHQLGDSDVLYCKQSSSTRRRRSTQANKGQVLMTMVDERPDTIRPATARPSRVLAYELVQGALVRWTESNDKTTAEPPTAVFLHGILGGRRNWASFAKRLAREFPSWQFLLVDLRCHGDSSTLPRRGLDTVGSAALDVLKLIGQLKLTPRLLVGHSFGGKVALSMVDQAAKPLPRPVKVWVLDATPGLVRAGGSGEDHPEELIAALRDMPLVVPSRRWVIENLLRKGFSAGIAQWMTTNLKPVEDVNGSKNPGLSWVFNLDGIASMYQSYEDTNLWPLVEDVPEGVHINFLRAERSLHRWAQEDVQRIHDAELTASTEGAGVEMHVLEDAGHWVHTDNPDGLFRILSPSLGGKRL